jgi:hypothetical protein
MEPETSCDVGEHAVNIASNGQLNNVEEASKDEPCLFDIRREKETFQEFKKQLNTIEDPNVLTEEEWQTMEEKILHLLSDLSFQRRTTTHRYDDVSSLGETTQFPRLSLQSESQTSPSRNMTPQSVISHMSSSLLLLEAVLMIRYLPSLTNRLTTQSGWSSVTVQLNDLGLRFKWGERSIQWNVTSGTYMAIISDKDRSYILHLKRPEIREEVFVQFSTAAELELWGNDLFQCSMRNALREREQLLSPMTDKKSKRSLTGSTVLSSMKHVIKKSVGDRIISDV